MVELFAFQRVVEVLIWNPFKTYVVQIHCEKSYDFNLLSFFAKYLPPRCLAGFTNIYEKVFIKFVKTNTWRDLLPFIQFAHHNKHQLIKSIKRFKTFSFL